MSNVIAMYSISGCRHSSASPIFALRAACAVVASSRFPHGADRAGVGFVCFR